MALKLVNRSMPFHLLLGTDLDFFRPQHKLVKVGKLVILDGDRQETIDITCFLDTGTLLMDGRFAPSYFTIGETLNWYIGETITDMDIEELFFDNSDMRGERPAHSWEKRTFLLGHWKQYAKNNTEIRVVVRLDDPELNKNESVYLLIHELQTSDTTKKNNESSPKPLVIQPFS